MLYQAVSRQSGRSFLVSGACLSHSVRSVSLQSVTNSSSSDGGYWTSEDWLSPRWKASISIPFMFLQLTSLLLCQNGNKTVWIEECSCSLHLQRSLMQVQQIPHEKSCTVIEYLWIICTEWLDERISLIMARIGEFKPAINTRWTIF